MKLTRVLIERDGGALELDLIRVLAVTIVTHKLESTIGTHNHKYFHYRRIRTPFFHPFFSKN
jgi:hypothetical protein